MTYLWRLLYLVLKYFAITNFWDPGYSRSRDPSDPWRDLMMALHVTVQLVTTAVILHFGEVQSLTTILVLEAVLLAACTVLERKASVVGALKAYVIAELVMLLGYGAMVYLSSKP